MTTPYTPGLPGAEAGGGGDRPGQLQPRHHYDRQRHGRRHLPGALTTETIKRIILETKPDSLLAGLGGQTGLTIAMELDHEGFLKEHNVRLIGTNAEAIDKAEDRQLFKDAMAKIGQPTIPSDTAHDIDACVAIADRIGYPVIIRPAFTLGGGGGGVAYNEAEPGEGRRGSDYSPITQVLIEKYIFGWKEIEFEVMRDHKGTAITICSMENFDPWASTPETPSWWPPPSP